MSDLTLEEMASVVADGHRILMWWDDVVPGCPFKVVQPPERVLAQVIIYLINEFEQAVLIFKCLTWSCHSGKDKDATTAKSRATSSGSGLRR